MTEGFHTFVLEPLGQLRYHAGVRVMPETIRAVVGNTNVFVEVPSILDRSKAMVQRADRAP